MPTETEIKRKYTQEPAEASSRSVLGGPFVDVDLLRLKTFSSVSQDDSPSLADTDLSSIEGYDSDDDLALSIPESVRKTRRPLQWEFKGLTVWLEYEEFDRDLSNAVDHAARLYGTEGIPVPHSTAIYGMEHLTHEEAIERLNKIPTVLSKWPLMESPRGVTCDISREGQPGQVCTIAWAELTLRTNDQHEQALDTLHELFGVTRSGGPWTPHISLAYDNPDDSVLNMSDTLYYVLKNQSLLQPRRVRSISLWDTQGKMAEWRCLDRVHLQYE